MVSPSLEEQVADLTTQLNERDRHIAAQNRTIDDLVDRYEYVLTTKRHPLFLRLTAAARKVLPASAYERISSTLRRSPRA